jgi:hypothetical protein
MEDPSRGEQGSRRAVDGRYLVASLIECRAGPSMAFPAKRAVALSFPAGPSLPRLRIVMLELNMQFRVTEARRLAILRPPDLKAMVTGPLHTPRSMPSVFWKKPDTRSRRIGGLSQPLSRKVAGSAGARVGRALTIIWADRGVTMPASSAGSRGTSGTGGTVGTVGRVGTVGTGGTGGGGGFGGGDWAAATAGTTAIAKTMKKGATCRRLCNMQHILTPPPWANLGRK